MSMKWKKFKKERISLNYTVMLLPHSQKKAIHFKMPVWTFGVAFLALLALTGTCLFFAGSRHQLKQVQREKEQLEQEWEQLAEQKRLADEENKALKAEQELQEQELMALEERTRNTLKELEDLVERESQIRQELGLGQIAKETDAREEDGESPNDSENGEPEDTEDSQGENGDLPNRASDDVSGSGTGNIDIRTAEGSGVVRIASAELPLILDQNDASFTAIQAELGYLQSMLTEKTGQYDSYLNTIEEKKAAKAAEKARKEALRTSIVTNALQYVGNPYVYGGSNPNTGVDCSGFTKYILGNTAGVSLNRTAAEQSTQGRAVSAENARPGDLVFYSNGSTVNHVAIYIGDGRVVHASNERVGITTSNMYYRTPVKIVNMLGD